MFVECIRFYVSLASCLESGWPPHEHSENVLLDFLKQICFVINYACMCNRVTSAFGAEVDEF